MTRDMGNHYPAGKLTVKGKVFEIVTTDSGEWVAYVNQAKVAAKTKDDLKKAIGRALAKEKISVAVRFMTAQEDYAGNVVVRRGTATGVHSASQNILVRWDNGETSQERAWGGQSYMRDSDELAAEYKQIRHSYLTAVRALSKFEKDNKMDLRGEVRTALDAAVSSEGEAE